MKLDPRPHPLFAAFLLLALSLVPLMALRDITPANELRYLSIADEALADGRIFTFSNHGEPYSDKPPLYLWLVMLSRLIPGGQDIFVLSLMSFIPALVTIGVMDRWLVLVAGQTTIRFTWLDRFAAAMMLGTSAMFAGTSVILRMDMLMTMFIVLSLFVFYKQYRHIGNPVLNGVLLPVCIFLALFTKGPVGLLVPVTSIFFFLMFSGKLRDTGKYLGFRTWGIIAVLCAFWFSGVWLEGGKEYLSDLLFHQTLGRAVDAFHHKEPFWYYFAAVWYVAAPYSLLMIYTVIFRSGRHVYVTDAGRLFLVVFISTFVMLSLFSSKLSVYMLPAVPFLVYYTVLTVKDMHDDSMIRILVGLPSALILLAALAVCTFSLYDGSIPDGILPAYICELAGTPFAYMASVVLMAGAAMTFYALSGHRPWTLAVSSTAVSILLAIILLTPLVPRLNDYIGYRNMAALAMELKKCGGVSGYTSCGLTMGENMDAFLGESVKAYSILDDFCHADISDTVLMVRTSCISECPLVAEKLSGLHGVEKGDFTIFIVPASR